MNEQEDPEIKFFTLFANCNKMLNKLKVFIKEVKVENDSSETYVDTQMKEKFQSTCAAMSIFRNLPIESKDQDVQSYLNFLINIDDLVGKTDEFNFLTARAFYNLPTPKFIRMEINSDSFKKLAQSLKTDIKMCGLKGLQDKVV